MTTPAQRDLAQKLFQEFRAQCFWHSPVDLQISHDLIPFVAEGLRKHGGRAGFVMAEKLRPVELQRDAPECH
jgi:hypothetical protein